MVTNKMLIPDYSCLSEPVVKSVCRKQVKENIDWDQPANCADKYDFKSGFFPVKLYYPGSG